MAIGKRTFTAGRALSCEVQLKENGAFLPVPQFKVQERQADGSYKTLAGADLKALTGVDGPARDIAGDLVGVDTRTGEYEGSPILNVSLSLRDAKANEIYFTKYILGSSIGRGISNSILNLPARTNVQIGLYAQKNPTTKKTYAAVSVRQGDNTETVKGKYDKKTAPEMQPRVFEGKGGKPENDWTKVHEFLFAELTALGESLRANRDTRNETQSEPVDHTQSSTPAPEPVTAGVEDDGPDGPLPF